MAGFTGCGVIFYLLDLIFKAVGSTRCAPLSPLTHPCNSSEVYLWYPTPVGYHFLPHASSLASALPKRSFPAAR